MDWVLSLLGIIVLSPLLLLVALAIRLDTPGPILFAQTRNGKNGRCFRILKFRTMTVLDDGADVKQATVDDHRVTRVGAWLRRTSVDELPQLFNVLKGDMSLVGPRPHAAAHNQHYARLIPNYGLRHLVKPGLTGWAQINGSRGETPQLADMQRRVDLDLWYVQHWRLTLDLLILLRTPAALLRTRAY